MDPILEDLAAGLIEPSGGALGGTPSRARVQPPRRCWIPAALRTPTSTPLQERPVSGDATGWKESSTAAETYTRKR